MPDPLPGTGWDDAPVTQSQVGMKRLLGDCRQAWRVLQALVLGVLASCSSAHTCIPEVALTHQGMPIH